MPKKNWRLDLLLRRALFLGILALSCGSAFAATASCVYPESGSGIGGTGISASGIGGTGRAARSGGIGGTGIKQEHETESMQGAGKVTSSRGTVIAQSRGRSRNLAAGDTVCVGETITTAQTASVEIRMADDGLLSLRAQTQVKIEKFAFNGTGNDGSLLAVARGACRVVTGRIGKEHPENDLIRTPSALVGVRGTDHEVAVILPRDNSAYPPGTYDKVNEGVTFIRSGEGEIEVHPGQVGFASGAGDLPAILKSVPAFYLSGHSGAVESTLPRQERDADAQNDGRERHESEDRNGVPGTPDIPDLPEAVEIPELPEAPEILDLPEVPEIPEVPE